MLMTFFSQKRWAKGVHPHESPWVMTGPLVVLAALSVLGGIMLASDWIVEFLSPVVGEAAHEDPPIPALLTTLLIVVVVGVGAGLAVLLFQRREVPREAPADVSFVTRAARADLYGDAINDTLVVRPGGHLVNALVATDRGAVDGAFTGGSTTVRGIGQGLRRLQTGYVRSYALSVLGGALVLVLTLVAVNL
jgi:NADH-quinone oxidoreductase subunit L